MFSLDLLGGLVLSVAGGARLSGLLPALLGGFLVAAGGGIIRDLVYGLPLYVLQNPAFVLIALLGGLIGHALSKRAPARLLVLLDLAASLHFAQAGAARALAHGVPPEMAAVAGVISALGGGAILLVFLTFPTPRYVPGYATIRLRWLKGEKDREGSEAA